ncbi:choline transport protein [[Candida] jaroonii]|uniref:Choline transport protein n=1 Tax=[Candida] jaroonii TaxID=467808 RepID=A0ACA9Y5W5_9ASCO|nr:choline transport protein [[Candida] jaroonii]
MGKEEIVSTAVHEIHETGLEKRFNIWSTTAMQCTLICSPLAIGTFLSTTSGLGGSPFLVWGFLVAVSFQLFICFSLAELASAYPHSSAQIHWTYVLAPNKFKKVSSYVVGILSLGGWIFACFASTFVATSFVFSLVSLYHPEFVYETYQFYLVYAAIVVVGFFINSFSIKVLPLLTNSLVVVINTGTLFILIALLVKTNPKQSASFVFKNIINDTDWSNGVVFFLGLLPSIASVCLFDGACHMTDEIEQPERNIPLVMIMANCVSAVLAFFSALIYMFCVVNISSLTDPFAGQPIVQLMLDSFQSEALTTIGVVVLIITFWGSTMLYYTSTSRLVWSFAMSNGLPFGNFFGKINPSLKVPFNSIMLVSVVCLILGTLIFGNSSALNAVLGSAMICINLSYILPILFNLYNSKFSFSPFRRYSIENNTSIAPILNEQTNLPYFHLGKFGIILNICSVFWACFITVWLCFPSLKAVTSTDMNYACVVLSVTGLIGVIFWFTTARRLYNHDMDLKHV